MAIAEVNGQTLYYEVHGEGEPLLCVMGLAADTLAWMPQVPAFSAGPPDGHLRQPRRRPVVDGGRATTRSPTWRRTRSRSPTQLELDTFHLLGVSMGGAIAQEIALAAPERVRTLTLAVTFARPAAPGPQARPRSGARAWRRSAASSTSTS